jgi:phosphatidylinositol glycan class U
MKEPAKESVHNAVRTTENNAPILRIPAWFGVLLRVFLIISAPALGELLDKRVEVGTPVTSFERCSVSLNIVKEGIYLFKNGVNPYDGGVYHQVEYG